MFKEFREFAIKGNVVDLAIGIIIGAAFGKIVTSIVEDIVLPPIGVLLGRVNFSNLYVIISGPADPAKRTVALPPGATLSQAKEAGFVTLNYGNFLNNVIQFLIIAFSVFVMVRAINKLKERALPPAETGEPVTKDCPFCLSTIPVKAIKCSHCTADLSPA